MSGSSIERIAELDRYSRELVHLVPDAIKAFGTLSREAQKAGALDHKVKELIALSIGVSTRCDGCIAYHARNSLRAGATRQEVAEALAVAVQMGGGPAMVHAADALRAFDEFAAAAARPPVATV
jgi:AhpD family alkylhydroperoxidase